MAVRLQGTATVFCRVLACDFDGTGASDGRLAPEVASALAAARAQGYVTLLVTGRVLEDLQAASVDFSSFDAVVAENGAVVWWPADGRTLTLGTPPPEGFLADLRARGVPFHAGSIVVGTWDRHVPEMVDLIRRHALASQLTFNREAMMLLPSGVDKTVGVRRALAEIGRSEHNMIAFGDAENDRSLLEAAAIGVAARGAVPALAAAADERLSLPGSAGVAHYIRQVLDRHGEMPSPERHRIEIGVDASGAPVHVPVSGDSILVSGDPRCGKSQLAGLVAERLLGRGHRLCVIDPEGDHVAFGRRPDVLVLGTSIPLPAPDAVAAMLVQQPLSLVANLSGLPAPDKVAWAAGALAALQRARAETGIPHWTFIDEAHYFFAGGSRSIGYLESTHGSVLLATYRPSLLANAVHEQLGIHLVMQTEVEDERYFITSLLQRYAPPDVIPADALAALMPPRVGLLRVGRWCFFTPTRRETPHAHHGRKYADAVLPIEKGFRFLEANGAGGPVARNVIQFCAAIASVAPSSLRHHLLHGDFSHWALDTLGDPALASGLRKLEDVARTGVVPDRREILRHVKDWYLV